MAYTFLFVVGGNVCYSFGLMSDPYLINILEVPYTYRETVGSEVFAPLI